MNRVEYSENTVYAAGCVLWRVIDGKVKTLLIHRDRHGDVSLPKGKVDPGETLPETAVREIEEETGYRIDLGLPLGAVKYRLPSGRDKEVHYWAAHVDDAEFERVRFEPNDEVTAVEWLGRRKAREAVSYEGDRQILDLFFALVEQGLHDTFAIVLARHAKTEAQSSTGRDRDRQLVPRGEQQAAALARILPLWGAHRVLASPATRVQQTIAPLTSGEREAARGFTVTERDDLGQDTHDGGVESYAPIAVELVRDASPVIVVSHQPVLHELITELASHADHLPAGLLEASALSTAEAAVLHFARANAHMGPIAVETHRPR